MHSWKFIVVIIFIGLTSVLILIHPGHIYTSDGAIRYNVTKAISERGTISISEESGGIKGRGGNYYARYGIGQSLLSIPLYIAGKFIATFAPNIEKEYFTEFMCSLSSALATVFTCIVLFLFGLNLGYTLRTSLLLSLIYVFGTFAIVYTRDSFDQPQEAVFLLSSFFMAYKWRKENSSITLILSVLFFGLALITRATPIIVFPLLLVYLLFPFKNIWRKLFIIVLSFSPFIVFLIWYNYFRFGSIFTTGYEGVLMFHTPLWYGIYGLLISTGRGLIFYAPITLPAFIFWHYFHKRERVLSFLFVMSVIFYLIFHSRLNVWIGGWCWGPRFLLPMLPLIVLSLGGLIGSDYFKKSRFPKAIITITIAVGIILQVPAVLVNYNRYYYDSVNNGYLSETVSNPRFSPLILQWQMCSQVIPKMIEGEPWNLSLKTIGFSIYDILKKTRSMNIIDFWWVHLYYMTSSRIWVTIIPIIFLGILGSCAWVIKRGLDANLYHFS